MLLQRRRMTVSNIAVIKGLIDPKCPSQKPRDEELCANCLFSELTRILKNSLCTIPNVKSHDLYLYLRQIYGSQ